MHLESSTDSLAILHILYTLMGQPDRRRDEVKVALAEEETPS